MTALAATAAALLAAGVTVHEALYYRGHPNATGVSGVLVALGLAVALVALPVAVSAWRRIVDDDRRRRDALVESLRRPSPHDL